ncbi:MULTISPECIES: ABC transporter substrate-binding protein [Microcella]|uniref:ABC transporter substrate-binding protein n=1 Tax=Microcella TaxID=337004 RepID=UPI0015CF692C|nr:MULTISPECIES: ABC transporter substrate-binding protein [Microcella]MBU1251491.1 ABC transporter substrate-binding protein [Actinomycetota bacterium]MBU1608372.1 ABC transporter substrate-binding protein [Actinomycetota bacterium]MBU2316506.1 ABC transporter substrate-binding protein [Actinomycetota bacterium]MBU2386216.1 ABC transporter substrate-binding protein [Actinomycetota bacterium]QOD94907.1 ABC transporter substrate-binding protein [Chryseoglobus sp. 28M-23]
MFTARNKGRFALGATVVGVSLALAGCATGDPLEEPDTGSDGDMSSETITVGSQAYYSNEIIAEIYAQALEEAGFDVDRNFQIGQRDAYIPAIEAGEVDLFPEYTGNLLQFYSPDTTATQSDDVYAELQDALPEGLQVLDQSSASDQDSYNVTADFAEANGLSSIGDLAGVDGLVLGGFPELEERPYGPTGLQEVYGVTVEFEATGDTTVPALLDGLVNVANVFSADPRIGENDLVTLDDPEGLFLASNVVPLASADLPAEAVEVINEISAALTAEGLVALNVQSTVDEDSSAVIATQWLTENGFLG